MQMNRFMRDRGCDKCSIALRASMASLWVHNPGGFTRAARQDDHAARRNFIPLPIAFHVVTDCRAGRNHIGLVDDCAANLAAASDLYPIHDHGVFDLTVTVNAHVSPDHTVMHVTAADD